MKKTNVMRILDGQSIPYQMHTYEASEAIGGMEVANAVNIDHNRVFKTLVTIGKTKTYYVFLVPVAQELDLKKAAKAVGEKQIEMLKQKDLLPLTGYVHGGCSPIGMKKMFQTTIHHTAPDFDAIVFSAGRIGAQIEMSPSHLKQIIEYQTAEIILD